MTVFLSCQEQLLPGSTLLAKWDFARRAGFGAIELRGKGDFEFRERLPELRQAKAAGVVMPTVCVEMTHFIGDFDAGRRRDAIANMASQLSVIAELEGVGAMTPASWGMFSYRLPPFVPPRSPQEDRRVLVDALGELGEHAKREGVVLLLEPLNRYEDHMVNRLDQAVDLIKATGTAGVRVGADTYHMNIEEASPMEALRRAAPWLGHVQVSDSNRLEPGAGHLDWWQLTSTLKEIGYTGSLAMECRLSGPPEDVLPKVPPLFH
ncbi:sugar phosphate isomerase/epimerase family protein [Allokutzneria albata]|uniref:Sugar phosphate isomerase/epimerase n=1 Tax=Allokutzneria albata TaxID=211114 RepID=A0A1H0BVY0_ALLAB|nr:sugar phosphate isomerase/epimerase family protein [Allokutzneria albata]SDN49812.1 Sugar phosphate isomerase/epimerase [Allokutzneria albata]